MHARTHASIRPSVPVRTSCATRYDNRCCCVVFLRCASGLATSSSTRSLGNGALSPTVTVSRRRTKLTCPAGGENARRGLRVPSLWNCARRISFFRNDGAHTASIPRALTLLSARRPVDRFAKWCPICPVALQNQVIIRAAVIRLAAHRCFCRNAPSLSSLKNDAFRTKTSPATLSSLLPARFSLFHAIESFCTVLFLCTTRLTNARTNDYGARRLSELIGERGGAESESLNLGQGRP